MRQMIRNQGRNLALYLRLVFFALIGEQESWVVAKLSKDANGGQVIPDLSVYEAFLKSFTPNHSLVKVNLGFGRLAKHHKFSLGGQIPANKKLKKPLVSQHETSQEITKINFMLHVNKTVCIKIKNSMYN